ncbi:uncharacterized protein LOC106096044 [Stomoxys calcitrans]|uniref:uncharacterized protein LOC106096044 n=1 Tax=Stomoxys calcitrans TaxID=35570 RepID=UPI0027E2C189|nr:uncharacterized protein LOC106096044 [Stomoxys calcitrans]
MSRLAALLVVAVLATLIKQPEAQSCLPGPQVFGHSFFGQEVSGAYIPQAYNYMFKDRGNNRRQEINLNYNYTAPEPITEILIFTENQADGSSSASILNGGIGQTWVSMRVTGRNTYFLRYMVVIFCKGSKTPEQVHGIE